MPSQKSNDQSKTSKATRKEELNADELDKVVGGLKKNTTGVRKTADPCEGGE